MIDYTLPLGELPDPLLIEPLSKPFDVTITPPGSKSITCRAYVLAALADGESKIIRPLRADDTDKLLDALCTLGAAARWEGEDVYIKGVNGRFPRGGEVNLGDGGAPTRFMIACACLAAEPVVVDGSKRMRERPIAEGVDMLRKLGATIEYVEEEGRLPVRVVPSADFNGGELTVGKTYSSQFITALLLIAPHLNDSLRIQFRDLVPSQSYLSLTVAMLVDEGIDVESHFALAGNVYRELAVARQLLRSVEVYVQPDASSAVYWWTAAALVQDGAVCVPGMGLEYSEPDFEYLSVLGRFNVEVTETELGDRISGRRAYEARLVPGEPLDMQLLPDAAIAAGVMCWSASGATTITGLHTLRHKETDRIAALANELRRIGCTIETTDDSITIDPSTRHNDPVVIETYNDHRMAMAFGVLGLARPGISISNPACVSKSYPTFWHDFAKLYQ